MGDAGGRGGAAARLTTGLRRAAERTAAGPGRWWVSRVVLTAADKPMAARQAATRWSAARRSPSA